MDKRIAGLAAALIIAVAGSITPSSVAAAGTFHLESTIAFSSTRDHLGLTPPLLGAEVYLAEVMDPDTPTPTLTNVRRLTTDEAPNEAFDGFANLSPDGKKIIFDSNRLTAGTGAGTCDPLNLRLNPSDLFLMNTDGTEQTLLTRGSSVAWSPDSKNIAFHASASYYASRPGHRVSDPPRPGLGNHRQRYLRGERRRPARRR